MSFKFLALAMGTREGSEPRQCWESRAKEEQAD